MFTDAELEHDFALAPFPPRPDAGIEVLAAVPAQLPQDAGRPQVATRGQVAVAGELELDTAWKLYGQGLLPQAKAALRRAQKAGADSPDLRRSLNRRSGEPRTRCMKR